MRSTPKSLLPPNVQRQSQQRLIEMKPIVTELIDDEY